MKEEIKRCADLRVCYTYFVVTEINWFTFANATVSFARSNKLKLEIELDGELIPVPELKHDSFSSLSVYDEKEDQTLINFRVSWCDE